MKTSSSRCKVDSVVVGEIHYVAIGEKPLPLTAKFGMVSSQSGTSFGSGLMYTWSQATNTKLQELIESMEADIQTALFDEVAPSVPSGQSEEDKIPEL